MKQILKAIGREESYFTPEGLEFIDQLSNLSEVLKSTLSQEQLSLLLDTIDSPSAALWLHDLISYKE